MSTTPHDDLVRGVMAHPEHAEGELRYLLPPELAARIDWTTLELVPGTYVDPELRESESDLLFRVRFGDHPAFVYLLFEHQSKEDALMSYRLLRYMVRFWDGWLEDRPESTVLPVVIPCLLCHAPSGWTVATRFEDLLDIDDETRHLVLDFVPRFRTLLDDLTQETEDGLRSRAASALLRLVLWCLKTSRRTDKLVAAMPRWSAVLLEARRAPNGGVAMAMVWRYVMSVHSDLVETVLPALGAALDQKERATMATIAEQLEQRGEARGIEKGERAILGRLLQRRFGPLPAEALERIERAATADLERWADRVLTAATLTEALDGVD